MNKPTTAKPLPDAPRVSIVERPTPPAPKHKPTGPMVYRIEKGADVWPARK